MKRLDCEYHLEPGQGHLWTAHGEWTGEVELGRDVLDELRQKELTDPKACGKLLFDRLFPPGSRLREGYRATEALAAGSGLRFCLHLDARLAKEEKALSWELVHDGERDVALARSTRITFVLCPHLSGIAPAQAPVIFRPRVLVAVADGANLEERYRLCALGKLRSALEAGFRRLPWRISHDFLHGDVTRAALQKKLREGRYDVLHLVAHGLPPEYGPPHVLLQGDRGLAEPIETEALAEDLSDCRDLRLVVLTVCHGAASLAGLLLRRGIPAVVAMRREISVEAAEVFTGTFYPALARSGEVDTAVNEARLRLSQATAVSRHWSDPMLLWTRAPWRKARSPWAAVFLTAAVLSFGFGTGWTVHEPVPEICPPPRRCPDPVCPSCPPRPEPILQVTRVAGQEAAPERELTVPPSGDIEGMFFIPSDPYPIKAESLAHGYSASQSGRSSTADWHLQGVRFRTPESLGETRATVTIEAGEPPGVVSRSVRVRVPAPRVEITHVCDASGPTWIRGTAVNVLEQEEQVWVKVRKKGDGNNPKCLYAPIVDGTWKVEDPWSCRAAKGAATLQAGLVAQPPGSPACPDGKEALDNGVIP